MERMSTWHVGIEEPLFRAEEVVDREAIFKCQGSNVSFAWRCDKSFKIVMSVIIMGDGRDGNAIAGKGISVRFVVLLIGSTHAAIAPNTL
jgi:hypothetical protein